ncbi:MAG: hypothetical protein KBC42_02430 [Candidatus Pacebacteria bacterium]|nr:hypothetical protein [Candidatus Paceibacterota bacterium]MBP9780760.1 hypothetical protein [Candidatus Paceibacterota bacterium]
MDKENDSELKRKALERQKQDIMEFQILMRKSNARLIGWENREEVCQRLIREINSLLKNINNAQWKEIEEFQRIWQRDVLNQKVMKSPKKSKR